MSVSINFYKIKKVKTEEIAKIKKNQSDSNKLEVNNCTSNLHRDKIYKIVEENEESGFSIDKTIEDNFEPLSLKRLCISIDILENKIPKLDSELESLYLFDPKIFMFIEINESIWKALEETIYEKKEDASKNKKEIPKRFEIERDFIENYFILRELFEKKELFASIS